MVGMMAALVLGPWAAGAGAQSVLTPAETRRESYPGAAIDEPVEMEYWASGTDKWLYVAGWMSVPLTGGGTAKVMAIARYDATNLNNTTQGYEPVLVTYPVSPSPGMGAVTYKATGIVVDPDNGDVYVCGEGTSTSGTTDYYVLKYKSNLTHYSSTTNPGYWPTAGDGANIRRFDGGYADRPVDIIVGGTGTAKRVIVTGSKETVSDGDDYYTIAYKADDGVEAWTAQFDYGHGDDQPVEMAGWVVTGSGEDLPEGFSVTVAGTAVSTTPDRDFLATTYGPDGSLIWFQSYLPAGDDICTGIAPRYNSIPGGGAAAVFVCGSTTRNTLEPTDTDYAVLGWDAAGRGVWDYAQADPIPHRGVRFFDPGESDMPTDIAISEGVVWVTGNANTTGELHDIGVVAFTTAAAGTRIGDDVFGSSSDGVETFSSSLFAVGPGAYIAGTTRNPSNDPPDHYVLLQYNNDAFAAIDLVGLGLYHAGTSMEHTSVAFSIFSGSQRFMTDRSADSTTGVDWLTLRY